MKQIAYFTSILLVFAVFTTACSKDENDDVTNKETNTNNNSSEDANLTAKSWQITYLWDGDKEETYHFNGYAFVFNEDNTVVATKNNNTLSGSWEIIESSDHNKLDIDFGETEPFDELTDDWHITSFTENKIELEDVSGGDGLTDYLKFEAI